MKIIFDVYPLLNSNYTGIPQTTWHLTKFFIKNDIDCIYSLGYNKISYKNIISLVKNRSGSNWKKMLFENNSIKNQQFLSATDFKERIYFSPHVMSCIVDGALGNARIIHDLSSITFQEFHTKNVVEIDAANTFKDINLSDLIFTVSNSSKQELMRYMNVAESKIVDAYPGVDWTRSHLNTVGRLLFDKPYVLILATKEPRKNLRLVFDYIIKNKIKILNSNLIFVFAGASGWGKDEKLGLEEEINELELAGKIAFLGFVSEELKLTLIIDAQYLIFPAFTEGFGSPVAEALSLGTPVVCSIGGSLPEVGGNAAYYFDPISINSLSRAINNIEFDISSNRLQLRINSLKQGSKFNWENFGSTITDSLTNLYANKYDKQ